MDKTFTQIFVDEIADRTRSEIDDATHFSCGSGSNAAATTDTNLQTIWPSHDPTGAGARSGMGGWQWDSTQYELRTWDIIAHGNHNPNTLREVGLFDGAGAVNGVKLLSRMVLAENIAKDATVKFWFDWTIIIIFDETGSVD